MASPLCHWCGRPYDPADLPAEEDFGCSPQYCSSSCEQADGAQAERMWRATQARERATYQQHHMLDPDWRLHLMPVGDADRCRHCTAVVLHPTETEFCSAMCEDAFYDAFSRWADTEVRDSDTPQAAA